MRNNKILTTWILDSASRFIHNSASSGIILFISTLLALFLANSALSHAYHDFWEQHFIIGFEGFKIDKSLHHWINDGLMSMFFFVVGLELKRELVAGELSNPKNIILPAAAGLGGMIVPALIYFWFTKDAGDAALNGWGIPMATDIAFALGVLYLLGDRIPISLKVFLTALAIIDDLGAVLVIAFFYTSNISLYSLGIGAIFLGIMVAGNVMGVRSAVFYGIMGIGGLWTAFLMSGVHATIAAVLAAFAIPATVKLNKDEYLTKLKSLLIELDESEDNDLVIVSEEEQSLLDRINETTNDALTPLQKLEHGLHPIVAFIVMPIFALANAGISFNSESLSLIGSSVGMGVIVGLIVGKIVGVFGVTYIVTQLKWASLPSGSRLINLLGVAFLSAIGFTMSLFITNLAFEDTLLIDSAKIGILIASLISGIIGYLILRSTTSVAAL